MNKSEQTFLSFMANLKVSSDPIFFFRDLELFFLKKLKFKSFKFYYISQGGKTPHSRRIVIGPKQKSTHGPNTKLLLKKLRGKNFILDGNRYWFLISRGKIKTYVAEGVFSAKNKLDGDFLPKFIKFIQNILKCIFDFQKELSLVDVDDVTGLYNQRRLHKDLELERKKYLKTKTAFSVLFLDIDHFKSVNDGSGHMVGSQLLSDLAKRLKFVLRDTDKFYRYGGDEFVIILSGAENPDALRIGRRILKKIKEKPFKVKGLKSLFSLSISIGVATFPQHTKSVKGLLDMADNMLYRAKELGRGRVCSVSEIF